MDESWEGKVPAAPCLPALRPSSCSGLASVATLLFWACHCVTVLAGIFFLFFRYSGLFSLFLAKHYRHLRPVVRISVANSGSSGMGRRAPPLIRPRPAILECHNKPALALCDLAAHLRPAAIQTPGNVNKPMLSPRSPNC